MTNLVILATVAVTNMMSVQSLSPATNQSNALVLHVEKEPCCVMTMTDIGTDDGKYLYTVFSTEKPCKGWQQGTVKHNESGITIRKDENGSKIKEIQK